MGLNILFLPIILLRLYNILFSNFCILRIQQYYRVDIIFLRLSHSRKMPRDNDLGSHKISINFKKGGKGKNKIRSGQYCVFIIHKLLFSYDEQYIKINKIIFNQ